MAVAEYSMRSAILRMLTASTPSLANISRAVARIFSRRLSFSRCRRCAEPIRAPNVVYLLNDVNHTDAVGMCQARERRRPPRLEATKMERMGRARFGLSAAGYAVAAAASRGQIGRAHV